MNCIAINEKPAELDIIKDLCNETGMFNLVGTFTNTIEAVKKLKKDNIDIVFLNILMPGTGGFDVFKNLSNPPLVVLTNNFADKSMTNSKTKSGGQQLKPLILNKPSNRNNSSATNCAAPSNGKTQQTPNKTPRKFLFVKVGCSTVKVRFDEIEYVEGLKDYVTIHTTTRSLVTKCTIKHIEHKLPSELFVRVHKSYIISIDRIDEIKYNHIFINAKKIPIGMRFKDAFNEKINHLIL